MILKAIKYLLKMKAKGVNVISIFRIKGHRIRASDKHLVYHFSIGTLLFVFVAVLLLLNSNRFFFSSVPEHMDTTQKQNFNLTQHDLYVTGTGVATTVPPSTKMPS